MVAQEQELGHGVVTTAGTAQASGTSTCPPPEAWSNLQVVGQEELGGVAVTALVKTAGTQHEPPPGGSAKAQGHAGKKGKKEKLEQETKGDNTISPHPPGPKRPPPAVSTEPALIHAKFLIQFT